MLSVKEYAHKHGKCVPFIYRLIESKRLKALMTNGRKGWFIAEDEPLPERLKPGPKGDNCDT